MLYVHAQVVVIKRRTVLRLSTKIVQTNNMGVEDSPPKGCEDLHWCYCFVCVLYRLPPRSLWRLLEIGQRYHGQMDYADTATANFVDYKK